MTKQQTSNKKLNIFLTLLMIANVITVLPFLVIIALFYIIVTPLEGDAAEAGGMTFGLLSLPFFFGSIPVILTNLIALPILLSKNMLNDRGARICKIIFGVSLALVLVPLLILIINNLFINPQ